MMIFTMNGVVHGRTRASPRPWRDAVLYSLREFSRTPAKTKVEERVSNVREVAYTFSEASVNAPALAQFRVEGEAFEVHLDLLVEPRKDPRTRNRHHL